MSYAVATSRSRVIGCRVKKDHMINYTWIVINPILKQALMVDPAWEVEKLMQILDREEVELTGILLTHHHFDHVNLAKCFARIYSIPIYIAELESCYYGYTGKQVKTFAHNETLFIAGFQVVPLITPGHTVGSSCYLIEKSLFTGDTIFNEGCGLCLAEGSDPVAMYHSLKYLYQIIPDDVLIYPGHRYATELGKTFKEVKRLNLYLNFKNVDDFVSFRMRKNNIHQTFQFR